MKLIFILLGATAIAFFVPYLFDALTNLARNIGLADAPADYLLAVFWAALIGVLISKTPLRLEDRRALLILWAVRCFVTLFAMLFYEYNYGLDAYNYYHESATPTNSWISGGGSEVMLYLVHWLHEFLPFSHSYHATKVIFSFIGFLATYLSFLSIRVFIPDIKIRWLYFIGLFPSVLFWSSILGKDPLQFFGLSLFCLGAFRWLKENRFSHFLVACLGVAICGIIRVWSLPILITPLLIVGLFRNPAVILGITGALLISGVANDLLENLPNRIRVESLDDLVDKTQALSRSWAQGGGSGQLAPEFTDLGSMGAFLPNGMFTALFRPLPGEIMNPFGIMAGFENLFLLLLFLVALYRLQRQIFYDRSLLLSLLILLVWSAIYGFISYQNLGNGVRFRLQAMPFLLYLIVRAYHAAETHFSYKPR